MSTGPAMPFRICATWSGSVVTHASRPGVDSGHHGHHGHHGRHGTPRTGRHTRVSGIKVDADVVCCDARAAPPPPHLATRAAPNAGLRAAPSLPYLASHAAPTRGGATGTRNHGNGVFRCRSLCRRGGSAAGPRACKLACGTGRQEVDDGTRRCQGWHDVTSRHVPSWDMRDGMRRMSVAAMHLVPARPHTPGHTTFATVQDERHSAAAHLACRGRLGRVLRAHPTTHALLRASGVSEAKPAAAGAQQPRRFRDTWAPRHAPRNPRRFRDVGWCGCCASCASFGTHRQAATRMAIWTPSLRTRSQETKGTTGTKDSGPGASQSTLYEWRAAPFCLRIPRTRHGG